MYVLSPIYCGLLEQYYIIIKYDPTTESDPKMPVVTTEFPRFTNTSLSHGLVSTYMNYDGNKK